MKQGFTLIELLAVIIILAIVALIATPIILNVVEDARISAGRSEASMIYSGINNYCATSAMEYQLNSEVDICADGVTTAEVSQMVSLGNATVTEVSYNAGKVTNLVVESNNHIFKLCGDGTFAMDEEECIIDSPIIPEEPDNINPTINQKVINTSMNENEWYKEDIYIEVEVIDNETGPAGYKRCMSTNECEPDETVYSVDNKILVSTESASNYVCVIGVDNYGNESEKKCVTYKLDKSSPTLTAKSETIEIIEGESNEVSNYFNVSYGISGGSISCSPTNTSSLVVGSQILICTATGGNGKETQATKQITVNPNIPDPVSFANDSWETIANAIKNNNISKYKVGDTKEITLSGYGTFTVRIANTSTPSSCSNQSFSQTACGFVVEFVDIITEHLMNSTATNAGGYPASAMYTFLQNDIYNALPSELKNVIINTRVVSGYGNDDSVNFISTDKIYLLATKEIWGKNGSGNTTIDDDTSDNNTRQLDYYENKGVSTSNYSSAIKNYNGSAITWWTRSAYSRFNDAFYSVLDSGDWYYYIANTTYGVAPAFRIG